MNIRYLILGAALILILPVSAWGTSKQFNRVQDLIISYNETANRLVVRWQNNVRAQRYQVRIYQASDLLLHSTTTRHRKRFRSSQFTEGESYRLWVRIKATQRKRASDWRKKRYTFTTDQNENESSVLDDSIYVTTAADPNVFTDSSTTLSALASVPEMIQLGTALGTYNAGDMLLYYVDFSDFENAGDETISLRHSTDDGTTWSVASGTTFTGQQNAGANVDPSLVQLSDGSLRLYFFGSEIVRSSDAEATDENVIYSAVSTDGVNFTVEDGERFSKSSITDPEVIHFNDQWIMYYSEGETSGIATSTDGLTFTDVGSWDGGGVPGAYVEGGSLVRIYGCQNGVINANISNDGISFADAGATSSVLSSTGTIVCDPSPVILPSGQVIMAYKKRPT
jgi:hypothetical protein